jgi:alpha-beta hydrolase superfamily lysophospholipase
MATGMSIPRPANQKTPASFGLAFTTHNFPSTDGIDLEGWFLPSAQAKGIVVLFHGYTSCKANLLPEAKAFHELGYDAFLVDFRGSGGSGGWETTIGYKEADDVSRSVEFVQKEWPKKPFVLFGQSMGSAAILRAVSKDGLCPQALVIEYPFDRLLSAVANRFSGKLPSFPMAHLLVFWGGVQHGFNGFRHNPVDYAREVRCPTLLLHAEKDPLVTRPQADSLFENLGGEKEFELFPGLGHESLVRAEPDRWRRLVSHFLTRHSVPQAGQP